MKENKSILFKKLLLVSSALSFLSLHTIDAHAETNVQDARQEEVTAELQPGEEQESNSTEHTDEKPTDTNDSNHDDPIDAEDVNIETDQELESEEVTDEPENEDVEGEAPTKNKEETENQDDEAEADDGEEAEEKENETANEPISLLAADVYQLGDRSEAVRELKENLLVLGYGNPDSKHWTDPDTYFGAGTEKALKSFQTDYGLPAGGVLDSVTAEKIGKLLNSSYSIGQTDNKIRTLKKNLLKLGYGNPNSKHWRNPDGYFGAGTQRALKAFQTDYGLRESGLLDAATANKIEEVLENGLSLGDKSERIRTLKTDLLQLGYGDPNSKHWTKPDAYFGPGTEKALLSFQADYRLPETGTLDATTANIITEVLENTLSKGKSHTDIRTLKTNLLKLGYGNPNSTDWTDPDSYFGSGTEKALKAFQSDYNLRQSGMLDAATANKIDEVLENSHAIGKSHVDIRTLKSNLLKLGYGNPSSTDWTDPDDYFGAGTRKALIAFQGNYDLCVKAGCWIQRLPTRLRKF